jgi:hypothetical protein
MSADEKLLAAAKRGDVAVARGALDTGADKECKDVVRCGRQQHALPALHVRTHASRAAHGAQNGQTPLWWAAEDGHLGVVQLLLERGAAIETKDDVRCAAPAPPRGFRLRACAVPPASAAARGGGAATATTLFHERARLVPPLLTTLG